MTKLVICIFFAFSDIFSCVLLQLMHYVDVCCWVGLGRVRSAYISCELVGWVCKLMGWVGLYKIDPRQCLASSVETIALNWRTNEQTNIVLAYSPCLHFVRRALISCNRTFWRHIKAAVNTETALGVCEAQCN